MTTYGPFPFATFNGADHAEFFYESSQTQPVAGEIAGPGVAAKFCHDTNGGNSANIGPQFGPNGDPSGYNVTECSSPGANGDTYRQRFLTVLDFSAERYDYNLETCQKGDTNASTIDIEIREGGGAWITVGSFGGGSDPFKLNTGDATVWTQRGVDLSQGGIRTHASTEVSFEITTQATTVWHGDYGTGNDEFVGTLLQTYAVSGTTLDSAGDPLGSCDVYLVREAATPVFLAHQVSNAVSGAYAFTGLATEGDETYVLAFKDGAPVRLDRTGLIIPAAE